MSAGNQTIPSPINALPRFLKVNEVADLLRCKKRTIYDMVEQDRIPHRKVGGRLLFDLNELIEWTKCSLHETPITEYSARRSPGCNRKGER
jgi:excisionase family DNA binding protein